jgi:hypothetical protein
VSALVCWYLRSTPFGQLKFCLFQINALENECSHASPSLLALLDCGAKASDEEENFVSDYMLSLKTQQATTSPTGLNHCFLKQTQFQYNTTQMIRKSWKSC